MKAVVVSTFSVGTNERKKCPIVGKLELPSAEMSTQPVLFLPGSTPSGSQGENRA